MPLVNIDRPTDLDKIHIKRMFHALAQIIAELILLQDKKVNSILEAYKITLWPGPRLGIEYADGMHQILEVELAEEHSKNSPKQIVKESKMPTKKKKKGY